MTIKHSITVMALVVNMYYISTSIAYAGGENRFYFGYNYKGVAGDQPSLVGANVMTSIGSFVWATDEHFEFLVQDPKPGDYCTTRDNGRPTEDTGSITGNCYSSNVGSIVIYARSLENGDESNRTVIYFIEKKTLPSSKPVPKLQSPTPQLTSKPSPSPVITQSQSLSEISPPPSPSLLESQNSEPTTQDENITLVGANWLVKIRIVLQNWFAKLFGR